MSQAEYLSILPILFYGLALADLAEHWKFIFTKKPFYPFIVFVLVLFEHAIFSIYQMYDVIQKLPDLDYWHYFVFCIPPMLLLFTVKSLTPEKKVKKEFYENIAVIYLLAFTYSISSILFTLNTGIFQVSLIVPVLFLIGAIIKKPKIIYGVAIVQMIVILADLFQVEFLTRF